MEKDEIMENEIAEEVTEDTMNESAEMVSEEEMSASQLKELKKLQKRQQKEMKKFEKQQKKLEAKQRKEELKRAKLEANQQAAEVDMEEMSAPYETEEAPTEVLSEEKFVESTESYLEDISEEKMEEYAAEIEEEAESVYEEAAYSEDDLEEENSDAEEEFAAMTSGSGESTEELEKNSKEIKKKGLRISFSNQLIAMSLAPMIIACVFITLNSVSTLRKTLESQIETSMKVAASAITETYSNLYEGDYEKGRDGKVYKGGTLISGDTFLVDAMKERTGFDMSLVFEKSRLCTTVLYDTGKRAAWSNVDPDAYAKVEQGESVFEKDLEVGSDMCYVYYEPIIDANGNVIGAVEISQANKEQKKIIRMQMLKMIILSVAVVVIAAVLMVVLSRGMVGRMMRIKKFLDLIIEGRLDHVPDKKGMKTNDELGDVYRSSIKLQDTFYDMVGGIRDSSDNLKISADGLSEMALNTTQSAMNVQSAVTRISDGARSQADSTIAAQNSVTRINQEITQIVQEVEIMANNARQMSNAEQESEKIISELAESSDQVKESIVRATDQIALMSDAVYNIQKTIKLIQAIAEETDLLSLNANIEAAKAGEAGRGFSVVADQIGKLAIQSSDSSVEIQRVIASINEIAEKAVALMDEVREHMDAQQLKLNQTRETSATVAAGVAKSLNNMENIRAKIAILNDSGVAISNSIDALSEVSEENAEAAENTIATVNDMNETMQQVQASSEELLHMADALQEAMGSFRL